jgi:hypothetical protein
MVPVKELAAREATTGGQLGKVADSNPPERSISSTG